MYKIIYIYIFFIYPYIYVNSLCIKSLLFSCISASLLNVPELEILTENI